MARILQVSLELVALHDSKARAVVVFIFPVPNCDQLILISRRLGPGEPSLAEPPLAACVLGGLEQLLLGLDFLSSPACFSDLDATSSAFLAWFSFFTSSSPWSILFWNSCVLAWSHLK